MSESFSQSLDREGLFWKGGGKGGEAGEQLQLQIMALFYSHLSDVFLFKNVFDQSGTDHFLEKYASVASLIKTISLTMPYFVRIRI